MLEVEISPPKSKLSSIDTDIQRLAQEDPYALFDSFPIESIQKLAVANMLVTNEKQIAWLKERLSALIAKANINQPLPKIVVSLLEKLLFCDQRYCPWDKEVEILSWVLEETSGRLPWLTDVSKLVYGRVKRQPFISHSVPRMNSFILTCLQFLDYPISRIGYENFVYRAPAWSIVERAIRLCLLAENKDPDIYAAIVRIKNHYSYGRSSVIISDDDDEFRPIRDWQFLVWAVQKCRHQRGIAKQFSLRKLEPIIAWVAKSYKRSSSGLHLRLDHDLTYEAKAVDGQLTFTFQARSNTRNAFALHLVKSADLDLFIHKGDNFLDPTRIIGQKVGLDHDRESLATPGWIFSLTGLRAGRYGLKFVLVVKDKLLFEYNQNIQVLAQ